MQLWQCVNTHQVLSIPMLCVLHMAFDLIRRKVPSANGGVFSEHPCVTGVSSEHPPCFHYFGLAQPTTDKQIEEIWEGLGPWFVKYLFIFKHFIYSYSYSTMSKTSAVWQHPIKIENGKKVKCIVCKQQRQHPVDTPRPCLGYDIAQMHVKQKRCQSRQTRVCLLIN